MLAPNERGLEKIGGTNNKDAVASLKNKKPSTDLDPRVIWQEALAKAPAEPGLVIATADFLFECGHYEHAAEFLKANLRQGIVVRSWVYDALAVCLEMCKGDPEEIRRARLSAVAL